MNLPRYNFPKQEKLAGKKKIEDFFKKSSSFYLTNFRVRYLQSDKDVGFNQILISVPKQNFKKAVDRNLLKRRIREAYRLNKYIIHQTDSQKSLYVSFTYLSKEILIFHDIQTQIIKCLKRLNNINAKQKVV